MKEPLYGVIKRHIKNQIETGVYAPGDKIPTEMELASQFNTSRQTVNKALRDLVLDELVERSPRSGTFVKAPKSQSSLLDLQNIATQVSERGNSYSNVLIDLSTQKADAQVAAILGIVKDEKVFVSIMVHKENGIPVRYDKRYIRPSAAPEYINQTFKDFTPAQYLQANCPVEKVENIVEALLPEPKIREFLDIEANEPCLRIIRIVTSRGKIASYSKLYYPSSRYKLTSTFVAS